MISAFQFAAAAGILRGMTVIVFIRFQTCSGCSEDFSKKEKSFLKYESDSIFYRKHNS